jgi:hypothetical protein
MLYRRDAVATTEDYEYPVLYLKCLIIIMYGHIQGRSHLPALDYNCISNEFVVLPLNHLT